MNSNTTNPGVQNSSGSSLSVTDLAWLKQQAVQDVVRVAQEAQQVYFQHLQQLSSSGPLTQAGYAGFQYQAGQNMTANMITGGFGLAGAALTFMGSPVLGAAAIGAGSLIGQNIQQSAAITGMQYQQMGMAQQAVSNMGYMGGMSPGSALNSFMGGLSPERYGVGAAWAQVADMAAQYNVAVSSVNALRYASTSPMMPDGNPMYAERYIGAARSLAGLDYRSFGYDPTTYPSVRSYAPNVSGRDVLAQADAEMDAYRSSGRGWAYDWSQDRGDTRSKLQAYGLISTNTDIRERMKRTGSSLNSSDLEANLFLGGDAAYQALRVQYKDSPVALSQIEGAAQSGNLTNFRASQFASSIFSIQSDAAYSRGDASTAIARAQSSLTSQGDAMRRLYGVASGDIQPGVRDALAQQYEQMEVQRIGMQQRLGQMTYGMSGPDIARNMGWASYGRSQFEMFGDVGALQRGASREMAGLQMGINREDTLRRTTPMSPEQQAASIERSIQMFERLSQVTERTVISVQNFEQSVAGTGASLSRGEFQRTAIRGEGGQAYVGAGLDYLSKQGNQLGVMQGQLGDYVALMRSRGKSEEDIQRSPRYRELQERINDTETNMTETAQNLVRGPASVGIRREENQLSYQLDVLSQLPGTYGAMRGTMVRSMQALNREAEERAGIRSRLMEQGIWNEGMQADYEQTQQGIGRRQAGLFGQLTYGWQSMLQSEAINAPSGRMSIAMPSMSYMAAVSRGVRNPLMGSNENDLPFFLRQGLGLGSMAGATNTPDAAATTAITGVPQRTGFGAPGIISRLVAPGAGSDVAEALKGGITIRIEEPSSDGTTRVRTGTGYMTKLIQSATDSGSIAEQQILSAGRKR